MKMLSDRLQSWRVRDVGWQRGAELREMQELAMIPVNPPALTKPTKIRRISVQFGFMVHGTVVELGEVVEVPLNLARDLVMRGKAELV